MTTKIKIIFGFVTMMVIMSAIAVLGYVDLEGASNRFLVYRGHARANVYASDIMVGMGVAGTQANAYILSRNEVALKTAHEALDTMDSLFASFLSETQNPEDSKLLGDLRALTKDYKKGIDNMSDALGKMSKQHAEVVIPNSHEVATILHELAKNATKNDNATAILALEEVWGQYAFLLSGIERFNHSRSETDVAEIEDRIRRIRPLLQNIGGSLQTAEGKATFERLNKAAENIFVAIDGMKHNAKFATDSITGLAGTRIKISKDIAGFNSRVDSDMRAMGTETIQANRVGQTMIMGVSVAGVIIGALSAIFIIVGIVRVLNELSKFAGAVARGDFSYHVKTREKGEIGSMVSAMQQIPAVLETLINDIANGVSMLQIGHYRARVNPAQYHGAYSNLATSVNTVAEAYTTVLDELPLPIMSADKAMTVNFANKASQKATGGGLVESFVTDGSSFGKKAMETDANYSTETKFTKDGKETFMAVTTVPLEDKSGHAAAFIEILTDLTEIRTQQQLMLQVANQASEISNRVAAASEELAAQVEQVSRGAEVQRARVESTASAMTEMNATVLEVARSAGEASEQSDGTRGKAQEGSTLVNKVMSAINEVNSVSQNLHTNMQELGTQAESIGSVMNVISDIADQTNLLALNAAIEAARAGEAGRGFAVVADEVRKLAEKTMDATKEVGSSISAVQQSARVNIAEVGKAVTSIVEANELANSSGKALNEIVSMASANSSVVASIATAAEEQSATSEEISRAIDEINQIVAETTEGMVQSSAAVQDLSRMAQELRRVLESLR